MALVRFDEQESDVYVYVDVFGQLHCCLCSLTNDGNCCWATQVPSEMDAHLWTHVEAKDHVPTYVFMMLAGATSIVDVLERELAR